ncbi:MAG: hypothetical protein EU530_07125 [Promethearchaeota archaeon]|nr:MAG: hypothetical protein EU530_07125 [Candidatus Lokiarchaeota archaeon]
MKQKDIHNIVEAISFIESELQKDHIKLCKKVDDIQKMLTAINIRVSELENNLYSKKIKNT